MGRYYLDKKREADSLNKVDITWLKRHRFLNSWCEGTINWRRNGSDTEKDWIQVQVNPTGSDKYIQLSYKIGLPNDLKTSFEYKHELTTTPCNYGGVRYWFICAFCGRRVGALYLGNPLFCCRHCLDLSYHSKNENRRSKFYMLTKDSRFYEKEAKIRVKYYKGKPTKRYQRLLNKGGYLTESDMQKMLWHLKSFPSI